MNDLRYILNIPIETEFGILKPFNMKDYTLNGHYLNVLSITKNLLLQQLDGEFVKDNKFSKDFKQQYKEFKERMNILEQEVKNFDVICSNIEVVKLLIKLLQFCFSSDNACFYPEQHYISINNKIINRDNYDHIRNMIIKINNLRLPKQAKTQELQNWIDKARKANMKNNEMDMEDVITSIIVETGIPPDIIANMTVYQVNKLIARLNKIKEFDMQIQYICAGANPKEIKLDHWMAHIDDNNEEESYSSDFNSFKQNMMGILTG